MTTKFSKFVDNLFGFNKLLTESKYYISALRYVKSNNLADFRQHALFSQAQSQLLETKDYVQLFIHASNDNIKSSATNR